MKALRYTYILKTLILAGGLVWIVEHRVSPTMTDQKFNQILSDIEKSPIPTSNAIALGACAEANHTYELAINISGVGTYNAILNPDEHDAMLDIIARLRQSRTAKGESGDDSLLLDANAASFTQDQCPGRPKEFGNAALVTQR